jgi:LysM repeat protein
MSALWQANPGLGSWVYAGQVLQMPGGYTGNTGGAYGTYVVARGDTLKIIAARYGVTVGALASLNGIYNYNLIFVGQVLSIPTAGSYVPPSQPQYGGSTYVIQRGDTLQKLAYRWGVSIYNILTANPQITNASVVYVGQVITIPGASSAPAPVYNPSYYTVQAGDTLRIIASRYGTSVYNLQLLNPQIWNPNYIYWGMVIRVQ